MMNLGRKTLTVLGVYLLSVPFSATNAALADTEKRLISVDDQNAFKSVASPVISHDGKWIAYNSNESGRVEVYVASFPEFSQRRQVSNTGGSQALWRRDGKELFYLQLDGQLMSVELTGSGLNPSAPRALFQTPLTPNPLWNQYSVTADGQRFLFLEPLEPDQVNVVMNWQAVSP